MSDYEPPDPAVGEMVKQMTAESDRQHARLRDEPSSALKAVVRAANEPQAARANALVFLLVRRDEEMPEILLELFDDPDQQLWRTIVRSYCPDEPRVFARLWELLEDGNDQNWSEAACALARRGDETLLPTLEEWLQSPDRSRRNVAIECLKILDTPESHQVLRDFWDSGEGDEEDRLVIAAALFSVGDRRGHSTLESTACAAHGIWSVFAATSIYGRQRQEGLSMMKQILDQGDLEAKRGMINQIWNYARLPHAFSADGIHEARSWVTSEMENPTR